MGKGDDESKDLRKEVEMTEHQATIDEVARQYELNLSTGLSDAEVKKVRFKPLLKFNLLISKFFVNLRFDW